MCVCFFWKHRHRLGPVSTTETTVVGPPSHRDGCVAAATVVSPPLLSFSSVTRREPHRSARTDIRSKSAECDHRTGGPCWWGREGRWWWGEQKENPQKWKRLKSVSCRRKVGREFLQWYHGSWRRLAPTPSMSLSFPSLSLSFFRFPFCFVFLSLFPAWKNNGASSA